MHTVFAMKKNCPIFGMLPFILLYFTRTYYESFHRTCCHAGITFKRRIKGENSKVSTEIVGITYFNISL